MSLGALAQLVEMRGQDVASVDHLSGGRFKFGIGAGWNREKMRNHGTDPRQR